MRQVGDFFRCLHCNSPQAEHSDARVVCRNCGGEYPVEQGIPILVRDWRELEEQLDQARKIRPGWYLEEQPPEQTSPWRHHLRKRREYVEEAIRQYLQGRGKVRARTLLDLGCGDGNHLEYLQKYAEAIYGSDYNLVRLVRSRLRHPTVTLFLADILDYPAREGFFEIIFFNHVLEHVREDTAALTTAFRLLAQGGLLILGTPNEGAWWWQLAYKLQPQMLKTSDHVHFYTAPEVVRKLQKCGFVVTQVKYLGWGPPHWGWDGRIRKYKWVDDGFELFGKLLIPKQASSLYILATKIAGEGKG